MDHSKHLSQVQYAERIGVSAKHIYRLIKKGIIVLRKRKIDPCEADKCIAEYNKNRSLDCKTHNASLSRRVNTAVSRIASEKKISRSKVVQMLLLESKTLNDVLDKK